MVPEGAVVVFDAGHGVNPDTNPETRAAFPIRFMSEANTSLSAEAVLPTLREAYDKLHKKYKKQKVRKLGDAEALFEEQKHHHAEFCNTADAYIQELTAENFQLKAQFAESDIQALQNRLRWFERKYIECKNDVVTERARNLELQNRIIDLESAARVAVPRDDPDSLQPCHSPPLDMVTTQEEAHMQETYTQEGKVANDTQPQVMIDSSNDLNSSHPSQLPNIAVQATQDVPTEEGVPHSSPQLQGLTTERTHEISITEHEIWHASVKAVSDEQMDTQHQGLEVIDPCLECRDQQIGVVEGLEAIETSLESRDITMPTAESGNTSGNLAMEISAKAHDKSSDQEMHHTHGADITGMELHLTKVIEGLLEERKLLQSLLQQIMNLSLTIDAKTRIGSPPKILFTHPATGLSFTLEMASEDEMLLGEGKQTVLECKVILLGTLVNTAPAWMQEDITFTIDQLHHFLSRLHSVASGGMS
ncbi:unnamed protein product [Sphagnum jensenii]|uniref:DUF7806 domain-containing protein n=1 Tax=Sphagnum jensenii TaxID=128206 RepID=A0ABP0WNC0_9BRYO